MSLFAWREREREGGGVFEITNKVNCAEISIAYTCKQRVSFHPKIGVTNATFADDDTSVQQCCVFVKTYYGIRTT